MDLAEMLSVIWKSKWIILIMAVIAAGAVAFQSFREETLYRAETSMIVSSLTPTNVFSNEDMLAASYAELALSDAVQGKAREDNPDNNTSSGTSAIAADSNPDSPFVRLSATNTVPDRAVEDANAVADALVEYVSELQLQSLEDKRGNLLQELANIDAEQAAIRATPNGDQARLSALESVRQSLIRQYEELNAGMLQSSLVVIDEAGSPGAIPSHPLRNTLIGLLLGAAAGVILGFAVESVRKALRWES